MLSINLIQAQRYLFIPCTQRSYLSKAHNTQCYLSTPYKHSAIYSYLAHSVAIYQKHPIHSVFHQPHTNRVLSIKRQKIQWYLHVSTSHNRKRYTNITQQHIAWQDSPQSWYPPKSSYPSCVFVKYSNHHEYEDNQYSFMQMFCWLSEDCLRLVLLVWDCGIPPDIPGSIFGKPFSSSEP